ncbi:MAG: ComF family protein [Chloroherpetonaceae bacterium]
MTLEKILRPLLHLVYPNVCLTCQSLLQPDETYICHECQNGFDTFLLPNESAHVMLASLNELSPNQTVIDDALSLYRFYKQGNLQSLIHSIKYDGISQLAVEQGRRLGDALRREKPHSTFDCIVPMPLHHIRKIERGYNQAERLARGVSEVIGVPVKELVGRTRYTSTQTGFTLEGRKQNIKNAFECAVPLNGEHVLLIDDVFTTGSTLMECAKTLKRNRAGKITIATLAVTAS